MITIQSAMLVVLGFSLAGLVVSILAPAYRKRAERLASEALKRAMPLTESEIAADKDRLRASYAITIHKLESKLSDAELESARQLVEINRRDASISALEREVGRLATNNEEHENARRVLELTIAERLPKVEQRLAEAKRLLFERDREISALTQSTQKQAQALDEATQINTQQRDEIHRLNAALTTRAARNRDQPADRRFETEVALRTELEALRARVRDQAQMLERLRKGEAEVKIGASGESENAAGLEEIARLRESLSQAERALQSAQGDGGDTPEAEDARRSEIRTLQSRVQDQSAEIARLKAALETYESSKSQERSRQQNVLALKSQLAALEAQTVEQMSTIQGLRAEIVAANEKLARQASYYMEEMRRLGSGTRPASAPNAASPASSSAAVPSRPSLSERISAPRVATVQIAAARTSASSHEPATHEPSPENTSSGEASSLDGPREIPVAKGSSAASAASASKNEGMAPAAPARRPGLLQRITGLEKPVA